MMYPRDCMKLCQDFTVVILVMPFAWIQLLCNSSWNYQMLAAEQLCKDRRTDYTQKWQLPISGVHPVMMEKSAMAGEGWGGGVHASPFQPIYHHVQSCSARSCWEGRYTSSISSLPDMFSVGKRYGPFYHNINQASPPLLHLFQLSWDGKDAGPCQHSKAITLLHWRSLTYVCEPVPAVLNF